MDRPRQNTHAVSSLVLAGILAVVFTASAVAQKVGEVPRAAPTPSAPKGKALEWFSAEGRPFWYRLPAKLDPREPPNLLLMLHGTGLKWGWAFWNYPVASGRFRGGDIVVAPEGVTPGRDETFNFVQGKEDGDQIAGLIKLFRTRFPVGRVYVYGHSQGAFFCYWFAGAYPELVDGIVAHAGNVLQVEHGELAKEKVAIGILHGKTDAVVPVDCAHRTYAIYKKQGYKKLKLYIVEGLTEQSGHWPLPRQVSEMLEWLDEVNVENPRGALRVALRELEKEGPELFVVVDAVHRAEMLLRAYRESDRKEIQERVDLLGGFVDGAQAAHAAAIEEAREAAEKEGYEPWIAHFTSVHPLFATSKKWRSTVRKPVQSSAKNDRLVAQATKLLDAKPGRASFLQSVMVVEKAPLAVDAPGLVQLLRHLSADPPPGVTPEDVERFRRAVDGRAAAVKEGEKRAAAITAEAAASFRAKHSGLFAKGGPN